MIYSYNKTQRDALISQIYFGIELYMFRTGLLSIISSLSTVYAAIGICHTVSITCMTNNFCCVYSAQTADDGQQTCPKHVEFYSKINLRN